MRTWRHIAFSRNGSPAAPALAAFGSAHPDRTIRTQTRTRIGSFFYSPARPGRPPIGSARGAAPTSRPALHVEHPPVDHLLRPERDLGLGPIVVGIEHDPADAMAGRHRDGEEILVPGRGRPERIEPEPARVVRAAAAEPDRLEARQNRARPGIVLRACTRIAAPGTGFPYASRTRPTTNLRPGAGLAPASSACAAVDGGPVGRSLGSSPRTRAAEAEPTARPSNVRAIDRHSRLNMARGPSVCFIGSGQRRGEERSPKASSVRSPLLARSDRSRYHEFTGWCDGRATERRPLRTSACVRSLIREITTMILGLPGARGIVGLPASWPGMKPGAASRR